MALFIMFGNYTTEGLQGISPDRTTAAQKIIKKYKGKVVGMYALLGNVDLVFILELPSIEAAMSTSIALNKLTGIAFATHPAVSVEAFDKLLG